MKSRIPKTQLKDNTAWYCFLSTFLLLSISTVTNSQCIPSTTRNATSAVNDAGVGAVAYSSPSSISSSNNVRAEADALAVLFAGSTQYLKATGFGFTVPSYASICGIVVEIEKRDGGFLSVGTGIRDSEVRLVKANVVSGTNLATSNNWPSGEAFYTYGSDNNLWGNTLTPDDVNASNFGVAISAQFNGIAALLPSAQIDNIRMTIHYNPVLPTHIISFSTRLRSNKVLLEWNTADEEDGEIITVQRTPAGQTQWIDIARFDMHTSNTTKTYSYSDVLAEKGNYSYRLRITNNNSVHIYSETKHVSYDGNAVLTAYPNPASGFISIDNIKDPGSLFIRNFSMQLYKLPLLVTGNNSVRIDTRSLPAGLYFASFGTQQVKFVKQ
jgi:hypothetical protein